MLRLKATAETHEMKRDCIIRLPQSALAHACTMRTVLPPLKRAEINSFSCETIKYGNANSSH